MRQSEGFNSLNSIARARTGKRRRVSSYDRTWGNDDGFSGKYSYLRKENGGLVIAEMEGAGVINRIWTPTPNDNMLSFYFDGKSEPGLRIRFSDLFSGSGFGGFGDIFDSFFGGGSRSRSSSPNVVRGASLQYTATVSFKDAIFGTKVDVSYSHDDACDTCHGTGGTGSKTCPTCHGSGQVTRGNGFFQMASTCPSCHGRGQVIDNPCSSCHGSGVRKKSEKLSVTIPCGTDDGTKLVLRGKGNAGPNGGPAGDLIVFVRVQDDKYFVREGRNVFLQVPISFTQAALGADIEVPVVDGGKVRVSVPSGIQSGKSLRLKGRGVPSFKGSLDDRGDMYLTLIVETPKRLGLRAKGLMKELAGVLGEDSSPTPVPFER